LRAELQAIADQTNDRAKFLRLAETLGAFLARLRSAATTLDVIERQRIVRLVVKEVLVGDDSIVIRHSIPGGPARPAQRRFYRAPTAAAKYRSAEITLCVRGSELADDREHRTGRFWGGC